jgi:DNA-directed RNA polymerase subunit RPC12/RpoP
MCRTDHQIPGPKAVSCTRCGHKFKPEKHQIFFKVRCAHCGQVVEQQFKNINQHAACPSCMEASYIPAPPAWQRHLDELKAQKEAAEAEKRAVVLAKREAKQAGKGGKMKRGVSAKRMALRRAMSKNKKEEVMHECAYCGAGISDENIQREEAVQHNNVWYCWDHVPKE